jgi:HK97 family phage prohead protease
MPLNLRKAVGSLMQRKVVPMQMTVVGDDEVDIILSTAEVARDGHILISTGVILENYRKNPIVLWQHDAEHPVGNIENIVVTSDTISGRVRFAPLGISAKADEIRGLVKSGVIRSVSIGFDPIEGDPLDPRKPRGGQRVSSWELLETSFVSVPSDTGAIVTARSQESSQEIITMPKAQRSTTAAYKRVLHNGVATRGIYQVSSIAYLLSSLCGEAHCAKFEAALEGDGSEVPGMLVEAVKGLADILIAMTEEETAELIADLDDEDDEDEEDEGGEVEVIVERDRKFIAEGKTARIRNFRRAVVKLRAGKPISQSNATSLDEADQAHTRALKHHRSMGEHNDAMNGHTEAVGKAVEGARSAMASCSRAIASAAKSPDDAASHLERADKALDKAGEHLDKTDSMRSAMKDTAEDAKDTHAAMGRSIKAAQRSVQSVLRSASAEDDEDTDSKKIQKPEGDEEDEGSRDADFRLREAEALALTHDAST